HEIRNPLANINALAQLLSKRMTDPESSKQLRYILENADIANNIIKDLLNVAAPHRINFEKKDIGSILENLCNIVETRCNKNNIRLIKKISPELPPLMLNQEKLQTAFFNLISNAIDAMPNGGDLVVKADVCDSKNEIYIFFEDTGTGIKSENLDKILEPFFTTKNSGTGLGLSLAYHVIKAHSGRIEIESNVGIGTKFIIKLPLDNETYTSGVKTA